MSATEKLFRQHGGKCPCCGRAVVLPPTPHPYPDDLATVDHVIPQSWGGSNRRPNLQVLCRRCHLNKTEKEKELVLMVFGEQSITPQEARLTLLRDWDFRLEKVVL